MRKPHPKCIAIEAACLGRLLLQAGLCAALWLTAMRTWAAVAGTVVQLSGPLLAKKANGTVKILSLKSEVENGDTLVTEKNTYAMLRFIDNSEITLRPASTMTIENFSFDKGKPEGDQAHFSLVKGGLRSITGLLGQRNKEKFSLKTPAATIGIRGTTFIVEYVAPDDAPALASARRFLGASTAALAPDSLPPAPLQLAQMAQPLLPAGGARPAGLYVQVVAGQINVSNGGGGLNFSAGQFGYVPSTTLPPIVLPANPGLQFTPPPAFSTAANPAAQANPGSDSGKGKAVDCEVR
ncbi:FecR family protein [Massilia sp. MB5]|uniref:FecR family protein n=1 Tax=Massilia sp. MB5 TaxID=2919578 RepID=UPI0027D97A33|nr:FecR family protein [Massilia sp. MB5]